MIPDYTQIPDDMPNWHVTLNSDGITPRYEFHQSESIKFPPCYQFGGPDGPHLLAIFGHDPPKLKNTNEIQESNYLNLFLSLENVPKMRETLAKVDEQIKKWILEGKFSKIKCKDPVQLGYYYKPIIKQRKSDDDDEDKNDDPMESIRVRIYKKPGSTKLFVAKEDPQTGRKYLVRGNINNINYDARIVPEVVISHIYFKDDKCGVILRSHRLIVFPGYDEKPERGVAGFDEYEMKAEEEPATNTETPNQGMDVEMCHTNTDQDVSDSQKRFLSQLTASSNPPQEDELPIPEDHQPNW